MIMGEVTAKAARRGKYGEFAKRLINLHIGSEFSVFEDGTPANLLRTRLWSAMRTNEDVQSYLDSTGRLLKFRTEGGTMVFVSVENQKSEVV